MDLRVSVTDSCNFRCTYCMPKDLFGEGYPFLPPDRLMGYDELLTIIKIGTQLGVRKVKITGGEPLQRPGIEKFVEEVVNLGTLEDIGLITNGFYLENRAEDLYRRGLRRITVSLDSLNPHTFAEITGRAGNLEKVLAGIQAARSVGFDPVKVNMVVQRGINSSEILPMVRYFRSTGVILRFIEYMDVGQRHLYDSKLMVPSREIFETIHKEYPLAPLEPTQFGEVAQRYAFVDGQGEVGFISSMTQPFCGNCTRLRLSADGKLYRCLFSGIGMDVREMMRNGGTDQEFREKIGAFWGIRDDRYSEIRGSYEPEKIEMYRMGG